MEERHRKAIEGCASINTFFDRKGGKGLGLGKRACLHIHTSLSVFLFLSFSLFPLLSLPLLPVSRTPPSLFRAYVPFSLLFSRSLALSRSLSLNIVYCSRRRVGKEEMSIEDQNEFAFQEGLRLSNEGPQRQLIHTEFDKQELEEVRRGC